MKFVLFGVVLCGIIFGLGTGCQAPSTNLTRSIARDAGDTTVTVYLDGRDAHDVDERKTRIVLIVREIEVFLDQGIVGGLTINAIREQVNNIVPIEYQNISNTVLQYLSGYGAPTDKVPPKVLKNIRAALMGIKTGVAEYVLEDRMPEN
jgi:hypothetical protein